MGAVRVSASYRGGEKLGERLGQHIQILRKFEDDKGELLPAHDATRRLYRRMTRCKTGSVDPAEAAIEGCVAYLPSAGEQQRHARRLGASQPKGRLSSGEEYAGFDQQEGADTSE